MDGGRGREGEEGGRGREGEVASPPLPSHTVTRPSSPMNYPAPHTAAPSAAEAGRQAASKHKLLRKRAAGASQWQRLQVAALKPKPQIMIITNRLPQSEPLNPNLNPKP